MKFSLVTLTFLTFLLSFKAVAEEETVIDPFGWTNTSSNEIADQVVSPPLLKPISSEDPYEAFNRTMFDFNLAFHNNLGRPLANTYRHIPQPARTGLENFIGNLREPFSALNSLLQGNIEDGLGGIMRFALNTTFGLGGVLDIASEAGLPSKNEDFGQTLFVWGLWKESHYLVLPFLGPTTFRNLTGTISESIFDPIDIYDQANFSSEQRLAFYVSSGFLAYVRFAPLLDELQKQPEPYIFARESYIQYRVGQLYNGQPPVSDIDQFNID
ncbi:MAG: VacJ family lipoprotein [Thiotrichales bacterium]|nr:VacJ family lipoprotein [Thiotrichales bacterium]